MHSAARLVKGETLNSALSVPIGPFTGSTKSLGKRKEELLHKWMQKYILFIDEFSMVSAELFGRSECRSRQVKKCEHRAWGGLSVIASGDFAQKTPVNQTSLAVTPRPDEDADVTTKLQWENDNSEAIQGRRSWEEFDSAIILRYSHRCQGALKQILDEMIIPGGKLSDNSWHQLQGRVLGYTFDQEQDRVACRKGACSRSALLVQAVWLE